jgi:ubiquinone/menaquinone biosynthesis C-methylase UbiE
MGVVRLLHRFLVRQTMPSFAVSYYERMSNGVRDFYLKPFSDEINEAFNKAARILDVGTGTGHLPILLARGNKHSQIIGLVPYPSGTIIKNKMFKRLSP